MISNCILYYPQQNARQKGLGLCAVCLLSQIPAKLANGSGALPREGVLANLVAHAPRSSVRSFLTTICDYAGKICFTSPTPLHLISSHPDWSTSTTLSYVIVQTGMDLRVVVYFLFKTLLQCHSFLHSSCESIYINIGCVM